jgi:ATP-dependent DNA helicase RecG
MVIESAERYGLASLHQLRGRVGRGDSQGYCLVFSTGSSRSSYDRLKHLESVYNGLELAEIDLRLRGHGDIYGTMQHGIKEFKYADMTDLNMLEEAKIEAQTLFRELDKYPLLKDKVYEIGGKNVGNN